tara:strand:- start:601 stop:879 length:279 start_codon:yes stop_codon:yes gene_type:complete
MDLPEVVVREGQTSNAAYFSQWSFFLQTTHRLIRNFQKRQVNHNRHVMSGRAEPADFFVKPLRSERQREAIGLQKKGDTKIEENIIQNLLVG